MRYARKVNAIVCVCVCGPRQRRLNISANRFIVVRHCIEDETAFGSFNSNWMRCPIHDVHLHHRCMFVSHLAPTTFRDSRMRASARQLHSKPSPPQRRRHDAARAHLSKHVFVDSICICGALSALLDPTTTRSDSEDARIVNRYIIVHRRQRHVCNDNTNNTALDKRSAAKRKSVLSRYRFYIAFDCNRLSFECRTGNCVDYINLMFWLPV